MPEPEAFVQKGAPLINQRDLPPVSPEAFWLPTRIECYLGSPG